MSTLGTMVKGVDYSHYQNHPDVAEMAADGVEFVIIKAWEGSEPDPQFKQNLAAAVAAGMPAMAYVYLHGTDTDAKMQQCFDLIGDTVLCLDWEDANTPATIVEAWMDAYEKRYARQGMAYYGLYPPDSPTPRIGQWPRWFAEYCSPQDIKLPPWDGSPKPDWRKCWAIWQSSGNGHVAGCAGNIDLDQLAPRIDIDEFEEWLDSGGDFPEPGPDMVKLAIVALQVSLDEAGYDAGEPDGIWGKHTQAAINAYSGYDG